MKLAVFTPLPPTPSGISDYSVTLLNALAERGVEVEAFAPPGAAEQSFPIRVPEDYDGKTRAMYHVGNSEYHDFLYPALLSRPGVLVLHDLVLHHARLNGYLQSPDVVAYRADMGDPDKRDRALAQFDAYRLEVEHTYPERGASVAEIALRMGGGRLLYEFPLFEGLVRQSERTFVHSESARAEVLSRCPDADVRRVRMGVELPRQSPKQEARRRLGLPEGLLLASFGLVTPEKRISTALRALARLRARGVDARYVLVGGTVAHYDARAEAMELGIGDAVDFTGRVSEEDFLDYAFAADLCLNLRYPSAGETSATLLRLLACGRPVVVTDQLHMTDFPDDVVARSALEGDEDGLYCDLMDLIRADRRLEALASRSRKFVAREHTVDVMTADILNAL